MLGFTIDLSITILGCQSLSSARAAENSKIGVELYLTNGNIKLAPFKAEDISNQYLGWLNDSSHMKFSNQRHLQHSRNSALEYLNSFRGTDNIFLGVFLSGDELAGTVTVYRNAFNDSANLGILISPEMNRQGLATKVYRLLLDELPTLFGLNKISSGTCELNLGMISVLEKSGMSLEYRMPKDFKLDGKYLDNLVYSKYF